MILLNPALQSTDQAAQVATAALQAPINTLIVVVAIIALIIVLGGGFIIIRFAPMIISIIKQLADTNKQNAENAVKLTTLVGQNADAAKVANEAVQQNTAEMVKQTNAIEAQTNVISGQTLDLRNYQTLVSDNLSAHTDQIAANTANIEALKISIESLSEQIKGYLEANTNLAGVEQIIKDFRDEIIGIIQTEQAKRATGTNPVTNGSQPEP